MSTDLAVRDRGQELAVSDPEQEVAWASRCAKALVAAISGNPQLKVTISNKDYIKAEGWQTLGAMTKVDHIEVVWCREYTPPGGDKHTGWEVRVEVRDRDGNVRGTGEAMCIRSEKRWATADEYAIRSMAQTRALGKAYRMALSYVVALAGYEPTPAEEMPAFQAPESVWHETSYASPADTRVHFGKNVGTRLGDLSSRSLSWYAETWEPGESEQDERLKTDAVALLLEGAAA